jgi:hypothetical protein
MLEFLADHCHPTLNRSVIIKLLGFTAAMIVVPIGSYFLTVNNLFSGEFSMRPQAWKEA